MELRVTRYNFDTESTSGMLAINYEGEGAKGATYFCQTLEDQRRDLAGGEKKVMSETAIPEGRYRVGWQEQVTGMTKKYRERYPWFSKHLHVKDVPDFTGIYIHVGNDDDDTAGCLLVGYGMSGDANDFNSKITSSTAAYEKLYQIVGDALNSGEGVWIVYKTIYL